MLWLMRRRKLDWGPALFAAVSLAFGSFMVERIRHIIFAQMMAWLPLVLVGVEGYPRRAARALAGAGGAGDGDGAGVRRAAAGAVRGAHRRRAMSWRGSCASTRERRGARVGRMAGVGARAGRRAHRRGADRADGGAPAVFAALARRRLSRSPRATRGPNRATSACWSRPTCSAAPIAGSGSAPSTTGRWPAGTRAR